MKIVQFANHTDQMRELIISHLHWIYAVYPLVDEFLSDTGFMRHFWGNFAGIKMCLFGAFRVKLAPYRVKFR